MRAAKCLILVLVWGVVQPLAAQTPSSPGYTVHPDYLVKHFTAADGLPVNRVTGIVQCRSGYLWGSTNDGLVRFDGHRFTTFNTDSDPALPSNRTGGLQIGPDGGLWIHASGKLIHHQGPDFTTVAENTAIVAHDGDSLVVSTPQGLAYLWDGQFQPLHPGLAFPGDRHQYLRRRSGERWASASAGRLYRIGMDGALTAFTLPLLPDGGYMEIRALHEDLQGTLWVGTEHGLYSGGRLYRFAEDRFEPVLDTQQRPWAQAILGLQSFPEDPETLWLRTHHTGSWSYREGRFEPFGQRLHTRVQEGMGAPITRGPDGALWRIQGTWLYRGETPILQVEEGQGSLLFDMEGNLWVGNGYGLYRLSRRPLRVITEAHGRSMTNIYPILEGRDGQIWLGAWGNQADAQVFRVEGEDINPIDFQGNAVSFYEDRDGTLWIGTTGSLCRLLGGEAVYRQGTRCNQLPEVERLFPTIGVRAMLEDRQGRFWMGHDDGILLRQSTANGPAWTSLTSETGLPHDRVRVLVETRAGDILFGTQGGGVMRYREGGTFETFTTTDGLSSNLVRDIYEAGDGYLWVATEDRGLCRLDRPDGRTLQGATTVCLTAADGLYYSGLHRILEDDHGRFWFNTNQGIFWVDHAQLNAFADGRVDRVSSVAYTERDGLLDREGNGGMQPAGIKASDGRLWFPSQAGAVVIDPAQVHRPPPPRTSIETVTIGTTSHQAASTLTLAGGERDLDLDYTALAFTHPEDVVFRVRLDGYDDDWRDVGPVRRASYTNLPPGDYTFRVRAGLGGVWNETGDTLTIRREPFLWETRWFFGLLGLLLVGVLAAAFRLRMHRVEVRQQQLEAEVVERTLQLREQAVELRRANALQSSFLANISHEFRTPLTLTFGPLNDLLSGRLASIPEARPHLERARNNGQRLLRMINQLLDLSRLDAGQLSLRPTRHDLVAFVGQRVAAFASYADERGLALHFRTDRPELPFGFDAEKLETVLLNLISNAFKFTPQGGSVIVAIQADGPDEATLMVRDTGLGIPAEHQAHLFERFYQVDPSSTRAREGSGLGLALVKQLVTLHGGTIAVKSAVGVGTTFTLTLPSAPDALPAHNGDGRAPADEALALTASALTRPTDAALADLQHLPTERPTDLAPEDVPDDEATVVLVVEDNADMRAYLRAHLDGAYTVYEAVNGADGLERAIDLVPDLVLSDVMMPVMDGMALLAALREDPRTSHVPVVLLTAKADAESRLQGLRSGADAYLPKPFDAAELQTRVAALIESRRHLRALWSQAAEAVPAPAGEEAPEAETVGPVALPPAEAAFLAAVRAVIEAEMGSLQFGTEALAEAVAMSPRQLRRKLRGLVDESPSALIRRLRLARAARLLEEDGLSVKEAAAAVGFRSASHFSELFHTTYGTPPTVYAEGGAA